MIKILGFLAVNEILGNGLHKTILFFRYKLLLLEQFLFYFKFWYSLSSLLWLFSLLLLLLLFCHCHYHYSLFIFNAFNFYYCCFYHSILSLYVSNIFKFQTYDVAEHSSKLEIRTLWLYQCLSWELWTVFV